MKIILEYPEQNTTPPKVFLEVNNKVKEIVLLKHKINHYSDDIRITFKVVFENINENQE